MGLFDTVTVDDVSKLPVPDEVQAFLKLHGETITHEFQSKDLDCCMGAYVLNTAQGILQEEHYEETGETEVTDALWTSLTANRNQSWLVRQYWQAKFKHLDQTRIIKKRKAVWHDSTSTGSFEMYTYYQVAGRYLDISFDVKLEHGKIQSITCKEHNLEPESEAQLRRAQDKAYKLRDDAEMAARSRFRAQWYYPMIREIYNPFVFFTKHALQCALSGLSKCLMHWHQL